MKTVFTLLSLALLLGIGGPSCFAKTSIAVIASKSSSLQSLSAAQVKDLYLGDDRYLPNGERPQLVDQGQKAAITASFYESLTEMSLKEVARQWAKIVFTGGGIPPKKIDGGDAAVKAFVKSRDNGIGYIASSAVDNSVKVLLTLSP